MQKPLGTKTAEWLNRLADELYDLVESGVDPTSALRKVAKDNNLTPEYIRIIGRAYNSGITNYYIHGVKHAAGLHKERVCNPEAVVKELYSVPVKSASQTYVISDHYLFSPETLGLTPPVETHAPPKVASASAIESKKEQLLDLLDLEKHACDLIYSDLLMLNAAITDGLSKIAEYFARADSASPEDVELNCKLHGYNVGRIIKEALDLGPVCTNKRFGVRLPYDETKEPYCYIFGVLSNLKKFAHLKQQHEQKQEELIGINKKIKEILGQDIFVFDKKAESGQDEDSDEKQSRPREKKTTVKSVKSQTSWIGTLTGKARDIIVGGKDSEQPLTDEVDKYIDKPPGPYGGIAEASGRKLKIVLTDAMLNDPTISKYSPDDVIRSYRYITDTAPWLVTSLPILITYLRKALVTSNNLDPVDQKTMLVMNDILRGKRRSTTLEGALA